MRNLGQRLEALSPEKRAILKKNTAAKKHIPVAHAALERVSREGVLALSFGQERMWFLDGLEPNSSAYNLSGAFRLTGQLNVAALKQSLEEIVRRHEVLRVTFENTDGQARLRIHTAIKVELPVIDMRGCVDREERGRLQAGEEAQRPFDLASGPLLRVRLFRLRDDEHVFLLTMHHIVSDAWSRGLFMRELGTLYGAFRQGQASPLAELPIQYADYAHWQRHWLQGEVLERQLGYWKKRLAGAPASLELPTDRPRPSVQTYRGATFEFGLGEKLTQHVRELSRNEGATLFMTVLATFGVLLSRYSGQTDLVVGSPIANRPRAELEGLIGFFVNTLALRVDLSGSPTFRQLLVRVKQMALDAYTHQDMPFERLVAEVHLVRDMSRTPLFQVMLALQNAPAIPLKLAGLTLERYESPRETAKFDLTLDIVEVGTGLVGSFEYNTDLFDAATIARMVEHLRRLLKSLVRSPDVCVFDLPILTEHEREWHLAQWNGPDAPLPEVCAHELFERWAREAPNATAIVNGARSVTYRESNVRANRLAHRLRSLGVGLESRVALVASRSIETVIGILGILKTGAAYVPVEPQLPLARRARMVERCDVRVAVRSDEPTALAASEVTVDGFEPLDVPEDNPGISVMPDLPMVVLHTSGSTGEPKGVILTHRGLLNYASAIAKDWGVERSDRLLQFASLSFDASLEEILGTWTLGATLVLRDEQWLDPQVLLAACREHGITVVELPTAYFALVLEAVEQAGAWPTSVRLVVIGGERAQPGWIERFHRMTRADRPRLVNMYGPTETSISVTCCDTGQFMEGGNLKGDSPLGRSVDNCRICVLDERLGLVPTGAVGELCVGGVALACGYVGKPSLTAEAFVPDAFVSGQRLYRTGDRGRGRADGSLEFCGRSDAQVKIRGFRIEPAEIEATLVRHPKVAESLVQVHEAGRSGLQLIAYVRLNASMSTVELRSYAAEHLPTYMVPSALVIVSGWPLTAHGKVDRQALPTPDATSLAVGAIEARDPLEVVISSIWRELLGISRLGIHDNFFELGGHSLLATQLVARMRQSLNVELPLHVVFEAPTVAQLAARFRDSPRTEVAPTELGQIRPREPATTPLTASFTQEAYWASQLLVPRGTAYNNLTSAWRVRGAVDEAALSRAADELVLRHESLRTTFYTIDGRLFQRVADPFCGILHVEDAADLDADDVIQRVQDESDSPFDLERGRLLRLHLLRSSSHERVLIISVHHIVADGWSVEILHRELSELYGAFHEARPSPLPALTIQYGDFATWEREWMCGARLAAHVQYWKTALQGAPPELLLPKDRPRPTTLSYRGSTVGLTVTEDVTNGLRTVARRYGATLFMTLLAGFAVALGRQANQRDLVIGTPSARRTRRELEPLIGVFAQDVPVRVRLDEQQTFAELLVDVRKTCLEAFEHQDTPWEAILEAAPCGNRRPVVQVHFALQTYPHAGPMGAPLSSVAIKCELRTTLDDLSLNMVEANGGLRGALAYSTDIFDRATIEELGSLILRLLDRFASCPNATCLGLSQLL
jgi:amino acid adenylation domain-containing protein